MDIENSDSFVTLQDDMLDIGKATEMIYLTPTTSHGL